MLFSNGNSVFARGDSARQWLRGKITSGEREGVPDQAEGR